MDAFMLDAVVRELIPLLTGARINKINQPTADLVILRFWTGGKNLRLALNLDSDGNALHLTERSWPNPFTPPRFCQLLRSRLKRLTGIEQPQGERLVRFAFAGPEKIRYVLVAELFGVHANLILLDEDDVIIDVLKRSSTGARRSMLPGRPYAPPPRDEDRKSLFAPIDLASLPHDFEDFAAWLKNTVTPMTDLTARDLQARVDRGEDPVAALQALQRRCLSGGYSPGIAFFESRKILSAFSPDFLSLETWQSFGSANEAVEAYSSETSEQEGGFLDRRDLLKALEKGRKKLIKRLKRIEQEQRQAETFEQQKLFGELLLANLHRMKKGMREIVLENYYEDPPEPITIPLDPLLIPQENAERYFRRYKKCRRGLEHLQRRIEETRQERQWLEQMALDLDEATSSEDLREIADELEEEGFLPRQTRPKDPRRSPSLNDRLRTTTSPSGFPLYWGRNPRTNDYVSHQLARAGDLWFHAFNIPGCHLVLKREGRNEVPEEDILYAAGIAAGYSRGRSDSHVEVMVTDVKNLGKPRGARPGLVTVARHRTVCVTPRRLAEE